MGLFKKFIPVGISLLTFAAFVGSVSGSLAWWAYSTRVAVSYQGTSVSTSEQLQIGLKLDASIFDDTKVASLEALGLEEDETVSTAEYRYVFAKAGGGLSADLIKEYLTIEGRYAISDLAPLSSRTYPDNYAATGHPRDIRLYENIIAGNVVNTERAETGKYVYLPFAFRILKLNAVSSSDKYAGGRDIYLSKLIAEASASSPDSTVQKALRVHFNNGTPSEQFILCADTSLENNGETVVAGCLDLNSDGYYDNDAGTEIIYGDRTITSPNTFVQDGTPTHMSDLNNMGVEGDDLADMMNHSTFLAKHYDGNTCYNDYSGITMGTAEYKVLNQIKPNDSHAILTGGMPLCQTSATGGHIAELGTTIWLEGWDHAVVDKAITHQFNLGFQFQIDLIN